MQKFTVFIIVFLSFFSLSQAQFTISGTLTNAQNTEALVGANIQIEGTSQGTQSDNHGDFSLSKLKKGNYILVFSYLGYKTLKKEVELIDKNIQLSISLEEDVLALEGIEIVGIRNYPLTSTNVQKEELEKQNLGQDLPILLKFTPSLIVTSDAGAGVGYTGMRVRGSDASRTNVTINGVPLNDSESQGTFWVNMPDFASSVGSLEIQRGVGSSANGAGAFGASVNITTQNPNDEAYFEANNSAGSFNTFKHAISVGTGLLKNHFKLDARLSKISSDGYIDKASSDLKLFYVSAAFQCKKNSLTFNFMS